MNSDESCLWKENTVLNQKQNPMKLKFAHENIYLYIKLKEPRRCLSFCYEDQLCIKFQNLAIITRPENFKHQFLSLFFSESKTIKSFHVKKNTTMQYPIKGHDLVIMGSCDYSNKPQEFISDPQIYFTCHLSQTANTEKKLKQIE